MTEHKAFSLIELMIVVAIIGVLAMLIVPSYQVYVRRAHYVEVVQAAIPYKMSVQECFQVMNDLSDCGAGQNGVPTGSETPHGLVQSVLLSANGVIRVTPQPRYGLTEADDYTLTPVVKHGRLTWISGGGGVAHGYAN